MAMRSTSKSPLSVAREALAFAQEALPRYSSHFWRKGYTQHQHCALLALSQLMRGDYRGIVQALLEWAELREVLGLRQVPHYTTLCYAEQRLQKRGALTASSPPSSAELAASA